MDFVGLDTHTYIRACILYVLVHYCNFAHTKTKVFVSNRVYAHSLKMSSACLGGTDGAMKCWLKEVRVKHI